MSALRISRPGHPTKLVIQEPAERIHRSGRLSSGWFSGTVVTAGQLVQGESTRDRDLRLQREAMKRARAK